MNKACFTAPILLMMGFQCLGQKILDDSTQLVYGPTTSRYFYEHDLKHGDTVYHDIDTSLYKLEQFEFLSSAPKAYQDLGNNGTALCPIYYEIPEHIGRRTGFDAYTPYAKTADEFKYYNTRSPYIGLYVGFGGLNRNRIDFDFSRNINPQWNVGFDIQRVASNQQVGSVSIREVQLLSTSLDLYTAHRSKNSKYHLLFHVFRMGHQASETGGIKVAKNAPRKDYFLYQDAMIHLRNARSHDTRIRYHLYQDYSLKEFFELYAIVEHHSLEHKYEDMNLKTNAAFYKDFLLSTDTTQNASLMKEWKITAGIKGRVARRIFYSAYAKRRDIHFGYRYSSPYAPAAENYLGGDVKVYVTPTNALSGRLEFLTTGQYYFQGKFENKFLSASYSSSLSRPSFLSERYFGNHYEWNNSFSDPFTNTIQGAVFHAFPFVKLKPSVEITTLSNYIYFDEDKRPKQTTEVILLNKYALQADFKLGKHFHLNNTGMFAHVSGGGANAMRVPQWNYFGRWYYENTVFKNFMEFQVGFDWHAQTGYYAHAYDPITQQFYLQNTYKTRSFWTGDWFFVMKAKRVSFWVKWKYFNQRERDGYFTTPFYPATRKTFDLGVRWHFYD